MVTKILMQIRNLITTEEMENYCEGEEHEKDSVNDDLENFFEDIQLGKVPDNRFLDPVFTYFLPKLTEEELNLVKKYDYDFVRAFRDKKLGGIHQLLRIVPHRDCVNLDEGEFTRCISCENFTDAFMDEYEMMLSESDPKFVYGQVQRTTFTIKNNQKSLPELRTNESIEKKPPHKKHMQSSKLKIFKKCSLQ